jgi:methylated-DNA-[protein]-cysteine S-methyltransferase
MPGFVLSHRLTALTVEFSEERTVPTVVRIRFGRFALSRRRHARGPSAGDIERLKCDVRRFLDGDLRDLSHVSILLEGFSAFRCAVLRAARTIPWGRVMSYGELAELAGHAGATRAAASVMRTNPYPLVVPCHRVVRADRTIGGFMGHGAGHALALKRRLLLHEGVAVSGSGPKAHLA